MTDSQLLEVGPADAPTPTIAGETIPASTEIPINTVDIQTFDRSVCEKCGTAMGDSQVSYCLGCGYYPSLGTYVEIDPWEKSLTETAVEEPKELSHIQVWINLLPAWGWKLIGCHLAVVAGSIAVRLLSPAEGVFRMAWSMSQLFIGILVFFACHLLAYLAAIEIDTDFSLIDFVVRPLKVWVTTVRKLPASLWQLASGTCGINAALMSVFVIGALPYHLLWDWGIKEPPKQNLVAAIVAQATKEEGDENGLGEAIDDFAGAAEEAAAAAKRAHEAQRTSVDCLIVGYTTSRGGNEIAALVLAREFHGELLIVGRVADGLGEEFRRTFLVKLKEIARPTSFVPTTIIANWVDPNFTCRITGQEQVQNGAVTEMRFDRILGAIE